MTAAVHLDGAEFLRSTLKADLPAREPYTRWVFMIHRVVPGSGLRDSRTSCCLNPNIPKYAMLAEGWRSRAGVVRMRCP